MSAELYEEVRRLTAEAQRLIDALKAKAPDHPTFGQLGIEDAQAIVSDYLEHGELGCAVHHLLYVVHESDIRFGNENVRCLHSLAARIGEPNAYTESALSGRTHDQLRYVYNRVISE